MRPEPLRIVQALAGLSVGGSELVVTELAEFLGGAGHQVTVVGADGPLGPRVRASGAALLDWPVGRKRLATLRYMGRLAAWLAEHQTHIVHAHSRLPAWVCWLAIRRLPPASRPAFVTSMHGQYTISPYSAVMARGDRVIAVSEHIRAYTLASYRFVDPDRLTVIHGGTSRASFPHGYRPQPEWYEAVWRVFPELKGKRILLLPGRLSRYKGHAVFLELLRMLAADYPDIHGVIAGQSRPGSRYHAELEGLAHRNQVLNRLSFTGLRDDIREWMAASAIVYNLCSDPPEAFGRIVPEALHLGVPVIGWDHGGVHETLRVMFPAGAVRPDSLSALVARTRAFLDEPPRVPASEAFLLETSMQKTLMLYQGLL
jgi:glycosyltransferase involved in cell wall biosynthesis